MSEYVGPIEKQTLENQYFRQVLFTAKHVQLVLGTMHKTKEEAETAEVLEHS